ncbi:MAG: hypothetical protein K2N18_00195, partial [Clostridia bacterium]|nr:hypothetical protein [Clostridia bacterium]
LKEIAELRERLSEIEASQKDSAAAVSTQIGLLADQVTLLSETATEDTTAESFNAVLAELAEIKEQLAAPVEEEQEEESPNMLESVALNVDVLMADLAEIKERLDAQNGAQDEALSEELKTLAADVAEIKDKLFRGASDDSALNMQVLLADVAEVKDRLSASVENSSDFVKMQDDLTFIRNQIEANMEPSGESDSFAETLENEDLSLLMDDVAAIKEKLNSLDEYDTVAEILSLREDVKSARLLDTSDVAAELEALKGDLMELKADLSDWKTNGNDAVVIGSTEDAPTSDEVNMLLGEIVSLRDEIQAYKDDVTGIIAGQGEQGEAQNLATDESVAAILDEIAEIKDMGSRRT